MNMMQDIAQILVEKSEEMDYESFSELAMTTLSVELGFDETVFTKGNKAAMTDALHANILKTYERRMDTMLQRAYPIIKEVYEKQGAIYQNIAIPISDGRKMLTLSVNLKKAYETEGKEIARALSKTITLWQIDDKWKEHLRDMDDLKQSVQNARPLQEPCHPLPAGRRQAADAVCRPERPRRGRCLEPDGRRQGGRVSLGR